MDQRNRMHRKAAIEATRKKKSCLKIQNTEIAIKENQQALLNTLQNITDELILKYIEKRNKAKRATVRKSYQESMHQQLTNIENDINKRQVVAYKLMQ